jgi:DHA2 family multidrug resistance protein
LRALKDRNFALGCFFSFITGVGIFATIYLTPLFLGRVRGFSALEIGLACSPPACSRSCDPGLRLLANRVDLRWLMMFGLACFALSMWHFTPITHDWGAAELLLPQALRGIGQQFAVPADRDADLGGLAMNAPEAGLGPVQPDAQPGRRASASRPAPPSSTTAPTCTSTAWPSTSRAATKR